MHVYSVYNRGTSIYINHSEVKPDFNTKSAIWKFRRRILITLSIFLFRAGFLAQIVAESLR